MIRDVVSHLLLQNIVVVYFTNKLYFYNKIDSLLVIDVGKEDGCGVLPTIWLLSYTSANETLEVSASDKVEILEIIFDSQVPFVN